MELRGLEQAPGISPIPMGPPPAGPPPEPRAGGEAGSTAITNEAGQSVLDIRDELQDAVREAIRGGNGSGDLRATVEGAVRSTLEENGFDPDAVKSALEDAGIDLQRIRSMSGGGDIAQRVANALGMGTESAGGDRDFVESFLQRLRAGSNLDRLG